MRQRRSGTIINISSTAGIEAKPSRSMYSASKFALEAFSEALYHEMKPFGVRVLLVEPGAFRTKFAEGVVVPEKGLGDDYKGTVTGAVLEAVTNGLVGNGAPVRFSSSHWVLFKRPLLFFSPFIVLVDRLDWMEKNFSGIFISFDYEN
jgi:short-subunit dehydrogenase